MDGLNWDVPTLDDELQAVMPAPESGLALPTAVEADWAVRKIRQYEQSGQQVMKDAALYRARINSAESAALSKIAEKIAWFKGALARFFVNNPPVNPKEKSLPLPHGRIGNKAVSPDITRENKSLVSWLIERNLRQFVKTRPAEEYPDWAGLKKLCDLSGEHPVYMPTGEEIDAVTIEHKPDEFYVTFFDAGENLLEEQNTPERSNKWDS